MDAFITDLLDVLHKHGWRKCAEGQKVTQYCQYAERLAAELREIEQILDDPRVHNTHTMADVIRELKEQLK